MDTPFQIIPDNYLVRSYFLLLSNSIVKIGDFAEACAYLDELHYGTEEE